jgi:hypothetical protein
MGLDGTFYVHPISMLHIADLACSYASGHKSTPASDTTRQDVIMPSRRPTIGATPLISTTCTTENFVCFLPPYPASTTLSAFLGSSATASCNQHNITRTHLSCLGQRYSRRNVRRSDSSFLCHVAAMELFDSILKPYHIETLYSKPTLSDPINEELFRCRREIPQTLTFFWAGCFCVYELL